MILVEWLLECSEFNHWNVLNSIIIWVSVWCIEYRTTIKFQAYDILWIEVQNIIIALAIIKSCGINHLLLINKRRIEILALTPVSNSDF